ncbi:MAG: hypothetical protein II852_03000 [Bacteroidales bacterium]|nr:hypothetical protein [Bacteroidales bacterium]
MKNYKTSLTLARAAMTLAGAPTRRAAMMLLIALLTAATGWAQDEISGLTYNTTGGYYEIPDAAALNALSTYAQSNDCAGKTFVQTADITLTGTFNPIGGNSSKNYYGFLGTYDGGGHTISGLNVSVTSTSWGFAVAGLFGGIDGGGTVRNVGLIAPSVSCSTSSDRNRAGAIAGDVQDPKSSVTHCFVLNPGSITASGGTTYTGLFFGAKKNSGTYANLYYYGTTSLSMCGYGDIGSNHIGQIYKVTAGTNVGLPATADETGFIAAGSHYYRQGASLELSYTGSNPNYYRPVYSVSPTGTGATVLSHNVLTVGNADITVSATLSSEQLIDIATGTLASIPDQVYTGSAITPAITLTVGGKVLTEWTDYTVTFTNNTDVGTATVTLNGEGDYAGTISKTFNIIAHSFSGSGTAASPYLVQTAADLIAIARNVNNGTAGYASAHYLQTADLDLTGCEMHSIGGATGPFWKDPGTGTAFSGVYDGGGHSISHLTINEYGESSVGKWYVGLFGNATGATIKGVVMDNTCSVSGYSMVGGLVGYADRESTTLVGNVFCGSVSEYFGSTYGALIGYFYGSNNNTSDHFHNNYYTESASPQQAGGEGKNWVGGDLTTNNGAVRGYAITLVGGAGLAEIGTTGVTHPNYAASGETVTLATRAGYTGSFTVTDADNANVAVSGNTFTMPAKNVTVTATFSIDPAHFSVNDAGDEYTIHTAEGWSVFCDALQDNDTYNRFSGKTVKLGADIAVSRMAGSSYHDFCGTFDGQGNTLTVNISSDDITDGSTQYVAPFRYVSNVGSDAATIRNLHVTGTITTDKQFTGGLIGGCWGTVIVENCRVSTAITSTISGDGTHGGIVGIQQDGALTITGCLFDGSLLGATTYAVGGFLGWRKKGAEIRNSLFAPAEVTVLNTSGATFARNKVDTYNSYYTYYLCDGTTYAPYDPADADHPDKYNNGHMRRTITAGENVTIDAIALTGDATNYTVSGITAYANGGLQCGETLYYGSGDQLSLTLSNSATAAPLGYQYGYTASAGTLDGTTLTMPDEDVTISVNTAALAPIDWATVNQGNSTDPYMIYNKDQLLLLAHRVNGTNDETANTYQGKYFKLGADITFTHHDNETDDYTENYEAIGGYIGGIYRYFKGNFDGDGNTVSGIRIRKDGSGDADIYQGLFGQTSFGANIHDVHLTDARIKGCESVGGIVGYNNGGNIMRCTVTDSYITATGNSYYGTIFGWSRYTDTDGLSNNYYHGCTVNGTAVTSGKGSNGADITANSGALPAYVITLGDGVSTTALASAPENGFVYNGVSYYREGLTLPLASTLGSEVPEGYTLSFSANGTALSGNTYTVNRTDGDVTITAAIRSDGMQHEVSYVDADGTTQTAQAIALDGTETTLAAGWYFVGLENVNFDHTITLDGDGDVNLILADGCTMNIGSNGSRINGNGIARKPLGVQALTIYGQTAGTGTLSIYTDNDNNNGIVAKAVTINGGNVTIDANGMWSTGINTGDGDIIINSGNVNVTATGDKTWGLYAQGNVNVNGGNVNATGGSSGIRTDYGDITLGWTNPADRITASSYDAKYGITVKDGQALADESDHIYTGTLTAEQLAAIANQKLTPVNLYVINGNSDETVSFTEQKEHATVIYDRKFTSGVASTIVLPFDFDATALDGALHTISSIDVQNGKWVAKASDAIPEGKANTPYLFKPNSDIVSTTFKDVTIEPTAESTTTIGESNWQMKGVYQFKEWAEDSPNDYGFAGAAQTTTEGDEISAGDFVRVGSGAKIRATRCYLTYADGISKASPILPDRITVIFPDATASVIEPQPADPSEDADPSGDITTPISEIAAQSGTKVWGYDGTIYIESQPYTPYTMIDLAGRTLKNGVTNSTREEVTLSRPAGIVIVRIGGKTFKIFNR